MLNTKSKFSTCLAFLALSLPLSAGIRRSAPLSRYSYVEYHMGVDARIVVYAPDKNSAHDACAAGFERMAELDTMMSDYRPDSELMRLCDKAGGLPVHVSPEIMTVLQRAQRISELSDGGFDVTVGPLVALWRKARKTGALPSEAEVANARRLVGWRKVTLDSIHGTVKLAVPGMRLDFGAIAKGYGDDEALRVLQRHGITRALVEMGGDIVVSGPPPGTSGWMVKVPDAGSVDMRLSHCAISTSGDTEQFVVIGGKHYSHVVDPRTGWALTSRVEATVIAKDGLISDPVSTAFTLTGMAGKNRLKRAFPGIRAFVRTVKGQD